jgi:hypothetical protein
MSSGQTILRQSSSTLQIGYEAGWTKACPRQPPSLFLLFGYFTAIYLAASAIPCIEWISSPPPPPAICLWGIHQSSFVLTVNFICYITLQHRNPTAKGNATRYFFLIVSSLFSYSCSYIFIWTVNKICWLSIQLQIADLSHITSCGVRRATFSPDFVSTQKFTPTTLGECGVFSYAKFIKRVCRTNLTQRQKSLKI